MTKQNQKTETDPRAIALALFDGVRRRNQPLDRLLAADAGLAALETRDRAFVRLLVTTMLRRLGQIDQVMQAVLSSPDGVKEKRIRDILRLGIAQILFLETAPHAAVDSSVNLAKASGKRYAGLINACLRRLLREGQALCPPDDEVGPLNHPAWMWQSWSAAYGEAEAKEIAAAHLSPAMLDISVKSDVEGWAKKLGAEILPTGTLRRPVEGRVDSLPGFDSGEWWVQDMAAALPAKLLGDIAGKQVLDLCAAPGGKTAQLAAMGANVTAIDRSAARLERLEENMSRLDFSVTSIAADVMAWQPELQYDAVLLDAPCSATGTIRRHPDVLHLKKEKDRDALAGLQKRMLPHALSMLKVGGRMIYCTCSLEPEEGEAQIAAFLAARNDVERDPILAKEIGGLTEFLNNLGEIRTTPARLRHNGGVDGFYAVRLVKRH